MRFGTLRAGIAIAALVAGGAAAALGADTPKEMKQLDKLQGYDSLSGEKGVPKAMDTAPNLPIESLIVWSDAAPTKGKAPLKVEFTADPPERIEKPQYSWSFGDGTYGAGQKVSHTFKKPGLYQVLLKVTNSKGALGEDEQRIKVTE